MKLTTGRVPLAGLMLPLLLLIAPQLAQEPVPAVSSLSPGGIVFSVTQFGSAGDGTTLDTEAIQQAVEAASRHGGGTVFFPPGRYLSGTIVLRSGVTLYLEAGATLLGSPRIEDYRETVPALRSYTDNYVRHSLIYGEGLENVAIRGRGLIDGQGANFRWKEYRDRPYGIRLVQCRDILVEGITLRSSGMWMQHYLDCENLIVRDIQVFNHSTYNNDGLDIDGCRNVRVSNCIIDSDDDALVLKSTLDRPCEDITVVNCTLSSHCNAFKLGTETNGGFSNVVVSNCTIRSPRQSSPIYGSQKGLAAIALEVVDGGVLERVAISNITIEGVSVPVFMRLGDRARPFLKDGPRPGVGRFSGISIQNLVATGAARTGCSITGLPGHPIRNVLLSDLRIEFEGGGRPEETLKEIPEKADSYPESGMFGVLPAYGFYCRHVEGLNLRNVDVRVAQSDARPAIVCDDVTGLRIDALSGQAPVSELPFILLNNVVSGLVTGSVAPEGVSTFLQLRGSSRALSVIGNDLGRAQQVFDFLPESLADELFATANRMPGRN